MIVKFSFFMLNLCFEKILGNFTRQNLVNKISTLKKVHSNILHSNIIFISHISLNDTLPYKVHIARCTDKIILNNNLN